METNSLAAAAIGAPRTIPLEVHPNLGQAAVAADGHTVAIVSDSTNAVVLDLNQPAHRSKLAGPPALGHLTFSPNGSQLASSATSDFALLVWDVASGKLTQRITSPDWTAVPGPNCPLVANSPPTNRSLIHSSHL